MKLKKKGSVEFFDVETLTGNATYAGVRVGLKHVGPGQARAWALTLQGLRQREMQRIIAMRKGLTPAEAPELYTKDSDGNFTFATEDGSREALEISIKIVRECIASVQGVEDYEDEKDPTKLAELIEHIGISESLVEPAIRMQGLSQAQSFLSGSSPAGTPATAPSG